MQGTLQRGRCRCLAVHPRCEAKLQCDTVARRYDAGKALAGAALTSELAIHDHLPDAARKITTVSAWLSGEGTAGGEGAWRWAARADRMPPAVWAK